LEDLPIADSLVSLFLFCGEHGRSRYRAQRDQWRVQPTDRLDVVAPNRVDSETVAVQQVSQVGKRQEADVMIR
jgi:hypothetical protein